MSPEQVAASYNQLAERWLDLSTYGFAQIERAVAFVHNKDAALDVGCGTGRLTRVRESGHRSCDTAVNRRPDNRTATKGEIIDRTLGTGHNHRTHTE